MVLLLQKIFHCHPKYPSKLENNHHPHGQSEALSASLQAFRSEISNSVNRLSRNSNPGPEFLSLPWIHQILEQLANLNRAFAKLAMEIDYPMNKWEIPSMEEYLSYSLNLLDLLNSISSSLSHLGQARISISHAVSLVESSPESAIDRLRGIQFKKQTKELKLEEIEERICYGKELVFHQALMEMKGIGYWVCGIVLFGLSGDVKQYLEMKKAARGFLVPSLEVEEKAVAKELREVNEAADCLVAAVGGGESCGAAAEELERKLEVVEQLLDGIGKEADGIFSEVLGGRNELLDCLRQRKQ